MKNFLIKIVLSASLVACSIVAANSAAVSALYPPEADGLRPAAPLAAAAAPADLAIPDAAAAAGTESKDGTVVHHKLDHSFANSTFKWSPTNSMELSDYESKKLVVDFISKGDSHETIKFSFRSNLRALNLSSFEVRYAGDASKTGYSTFNFPINGAHSSYVIIPWSRTLHKYRASEKSTEAMAVKLISLRLVVESNTSRTCSTSLTYIPNILLPNILQCISPTRFMSELNLMVRLPCPPTINFAIGEETLNLGWKIWEIPVTISTGTGAIT